MNRQHPRVLIVEDEDMISHLLAKIFESWHWDTVKASTVAEGIARIADTPFDLVVLDLMLPDGDGSAVLRAVRDGKLPVPVAVSTAKDLAGIEDVISLKPDALLTKPFAFEPLKAMAAKIYDAFEPRAMTVHAKRQPAPQSV